MPPILGYWNVRGMAQPIRYLLEFAGVEYTEEQYTEGPGPVYTRDEWNNAKPNVGLDFPNLPYWKDENHKLSQSGTILRYLGKKHGTTGKTLAEETEADMLIDTLKDTFIAHVSLCFLQDYDESLPGYKKSLPEKLAAYDKYLGDKNYLMGEQIRTPDFLFYEVLEINRAMLPDCLDSFPRLQAFQRRFEAEPAIARYMASDRYIKYPFYTSIAAWGFK